MAGLGGPNLTPVEDETLCWLREHPGWQSHQAILAGIDRPRNPRVHAAIARLIRRGIVQDRSRPNAHGNFCREYRAIEPSASRASG